MAKARGPGFDSMVTTEGVFFFYILPLLLFRSLQVRKFQSNILIVQSSSAVMNQK